jgi:glycosyltransferase involved in cell wall biosynthesis
MKILYDHQIFTGQKYGGISRYFIELYSYLLKTGTVKPKISVIYSENAYFQAMFPKRSVLPKRNFPGKSTGIKLINDYYSKECLIKGNFEIFHPTYYNPYFLKFLKTKPYVLTVYDMIHELFPNMTEADQTPVQKKNLIEHATKIIAISENTKTDIINFYTIDPAIIEVIPLATSLHIQNTEIASKLPQKFILFVGNRSFYKNFEFFTRSISSLISDQNDLYLICAGGGIFSDAEIRLFVSLNMTGKVIHHPIINDKILSQLYQKAILFAFPSLYEGFGIPILEAFSCGCPVAASNCSSIPEVGGDAVMYFDPNDSDSIEKVVGDILMDKGLKDSLRILGYQRLKQFSWQKTAELTKKLYDDIINETPHK